MPLKARLMAVVALLLLSVFVDSAIYFISFCSDAVIVGAAIFLLWPVVNKDEKKPKLNPPLPTREWRVVYF